MGWRAESGGEDTCIGYSWMTLATHSGIIVCFFVLQSFLHTGTYLPILHTDTYLPIFISIYLYIHAYLQCMPVSRMWQSFSNSCHLSWMAPKFVQPPFLDLSWLPSSTRTRSLREERRRYVSTCPLPATRLCRLLA